MYKIEDRKASVDNNKYQDPYQCTECKKIFVVRELARCCELKHQGVVFVRRPEQEPRSKQQKDN